MQLNGFHCPHLDGSLSVSGWLVRQVEMSKPSSLYVCPCLCLCLRQVGHFFVTGAEASTQAHNLSSSATE